MGEMMVNLCRHLQIPLTHVAAGFQLFGHKRRTVCGNNNKHQLRFTLSGERENQCVKRYSLIQIL